MLLSESKMFYFRVSDSPYVTQINFFINLNQFCYWFPKLLRLISNITYLNQFCYCFPKLLRLISNITLKWPPRTIFLFWISFTLSKMLHLKEFLVVLIQYWCYKYWLVQILRHQLLPQLKGFFLIYLIFCLFVLLFWISKNL